MIEYIIDYLKRYKILNIVLLVSENESDILRNHLGDGQRFGVEIEYSVEERLGTAGAVGAAAPLLGERFLLYYGDILTDMNLAELVHFHEEKRAVCTVAMSTSVPMDYGIAKVAEDGRITYFEEKPILKEYPVSMGILVLEKEVIRYCKPNTDISHGVIPQLLKDGEPVFAYLTEKRHYDIGTFKALEEVRSLVESSKTPFG